MPTTNKKTNAGKVKLTNRRTGKSFFKDPDKAKELLDNPLFKGKYTPEEIAETPKELSEDKLSGAASDQTADDDTNK